MSITTISAATRAERAQLVAEAIHSGEMEDAVASDIARSDAQDYIAGRITADQLVARTRARYGLA